MAVNQITQRDVRCGIKHGLDIDAFCAKYDCTHKEFERRVGTLYRQSAESILDEIHSNAKRRNHIGGAKNLLKSAPPPQPEQAPDSITTPAVATEFQPTPASQLELLQTQERQQSDEIIALESEHKSLARQHRDCIRELRQIQDDLTKIKSDFEVKANTYQAIVESNNELVARMNQISQSRAQKVALLEETRQSIQALSTIIVCAYENGTIEPLEDANGFKPDESGSDQLCTDLLTRAECEDLRLKDIRILSRMLSIVSNANRIIEPIFENVALEPFFQALQTQVI